MISFIKSNMIYIILILALIYKGIFVNIIGNINTLVTKPNDNIATEIGILKEENKKLKEDLESVTKLKNSYENDYRITRLSYRLSYTESEFYITGSDYKVNDLLINEFGLVGIIKELKNDYSVANTIKSIKGLSIKINDAYGTISKYEDNYFIVNDLSNYDEVNINDIVYTSPIGDNSNTIIVGNVSKIEEHEVSKTIYIKSNVDFSNLNYLFVVG
ncbi:MAG: hypothetical protein OSJ65_01030 [Bacilli bacterium]|nr:hypothetical protein [Bacilli bacterium]